MHIRFLTHDVAMEMAKEIVEVFAGCLRDEERREAFIEVYTRLKAGLEDFEDRTSRMQLRMKPCSFTRFPEGI
jgi:hypothetical protein